MLKKHPHKSFRYLLFSSLLLLHACTSTKTPKGYRLAWEENFNGNSLNDAYWSKIPRGTSDWNRHMSSYDPLYEVKNGKLFLRGIVNNVSPADTAPFLTGGVYTKDKKLFGFGRLEIRAKLNGARGAWPAFWMLPQGQGWPNGGEIDIMERLNSDSFAYQTTHSYYTQVLKEQLPSKSATGPIDPNGFNIYAVEKFRDSLVYSINGKKTYTYPRIQTDKQGQFPFADHEFYLLLDMQLGGSWVGKVYSEDLPVEMEIDWVKFYE